MEQSKKISFIVAIFAGNLLTGAFAVNTEDAIDQANKLFDKHDYKSAISVLDEAMKVDPKSAACYINRAYAYEHLDKFQNAIDDSTKAINLDPKLTEAYFNRGCAYGLLGNNQKAIDDLTTAINLQSKDAELYNERGKGYGKSGQYQKAIDDFTRAVTLDPKLAEAYDGRGFAYQLLGEYQKAINDHVKAIALDPSDKNAYFNCAEDFRKLGKKNLTQLYGDIAKNFDYRSSVQRGKNIGGNKSLKEENAQLNTPEPKTALEHNNRATELGFKQRWEEALKEHEIAIKEEPNNKLFKMNFSAACLRYGDFLRNKAIEQYKHAILIDPNNKTARNSLEELQPK